MTLHYTQSEQDQYEADSAAYHFETSMGFLNAHKGLRRGCFHLVLGTTGGGKSTLVRTLIRDFLFKKANANLSLGLWLSEESLADYKRQLAASIPAGDHLLGTQAKSEIDDGQLTKMAMFEWLQFFKPDVFILDNITTSRFYMDKKIDAQGEFVKKLKEVVKEINCAAILIAHTSAEVNDGMERFININDIRGSKSIANLTEFAYVLQRFEVGTNFFPTIRVVKHRSQDLTHNLYSLQYDNRIRAFTGDTAIQFEKFKEVFNARNKLK